MWIKKKIFFSRQFTFFISEFKKIYFDFKVFYMLTMTKSAAPNFSTGTKSVFKSSECLIFDIYLYLVIYQEIYIYRRRELHVSSNMIYMCELNIHFVCIPYRLYPLNGPGNINMGQRKKCGIERISMHATDHFSSVMDVHIGKSMEIIFW